MTDKINVWDIVNSITSTKKKMDISPKDYSPYFINKALSYHFDCVFHANMMNINRFISNDMQYDYLIHTIRAKKRDKMKWYKDKYDKENLEIVVDHYKVNQIRAKEILDMLPDDQLLEIKNQHDKGGLR
jgi:Bacteriophage clamp loader A subunit